MMKNTFEDYKVAVRLKYESEKIGSHSSFLLNPSRAKLRKLCAELFTDNTKNDDLKSFSAFFQFEFTLNCSNRLKEQTDKFRPIETFFKGETDLTDIEAVNIAAILVDFNPRPYLKFTKQQAFQKENIPNRKIENPDTNTLNGAIESVKKNNFDHAVQPMFFKKKEVSFYSKKLVIPCLLALMILSSLAYVYLPRKECMQWQKDHYEAVNCETKAVGFLDLYSTMPLNKNMLNFKKIKICDTTTFFKHNKPILWYCKNGKQLEFFNGPGFNPENDKPLKPITQYMINKYLK